MYESDFYLADEGFRAARVEETTKNRDKYWRYWKRYCKPLGVDMYLDPRSTRFTTKVRAVSGFAARTRIGYYGRGKRVAVGTVRPALTAVGQTIAMDTGTNPLQVAGTDKLLPPLKMVLDGWGKEDDPVKKKLPVGADVPRQMVKKSKRSGASQKDMRIGFLAVIAFFYLLRIGEYAVTGSKKKDKQTTQFRVKDVAFFVKRNGKLRQLSANATDEEIRSAVSATLRLGNQKNGWKNVCINHHSTKNKRMCPVKSVGEVVINIRKFSKDDNTLLSTYKEGGKVRDITDKDMRKAVKLAAAELDYPNEHNIPLDRIDTHSFRAGGANALFRAGYSDTQIQKMGRWRGETFKEYISDQLSTFSKGMSKNMMKSFNFVNIAAGILKDVTTLTLNRAYQVNSS